MVRAIARTVTGILVVAIMALPAQAITDNWNFNGGDSYTTASRWTDANNPLSHVVPGVNDTAVFNRNLDIAYSVTFPGRPILSPTHSRSAQVKIGTNAVGFSDSLTLNQLPAKFSIDAANTLPDIALLVGDTAGQTAELSTSLGDFATSTAVVGRGVGATGTLNVNGGSMSVDGTRPDLIASALMVGEHGTGTLNVVSGARVAVTESLYGGTGLGYFSDGNGTATVSGTGSTLSMGATMLVGYQGKGTLTVAAGGVVGSSSGYVDGQDSLATVTGANSSWDAEGAAFDGFASLVVAHDGVGEIMVADGGYLQCIGAELGVAATAVGTITVDGAGSTWHNGIRVDLGVEGVGA